MKLTRDQIEQNAWDWLAASDPELPAGESVNREALADQMRFTVVDAEDVEAVAATIERIVAQGE